MPAATATPSPSAAPAATGAHGAAPAADVGSPVKLKDRKVFVVLVPRAGKTAQERAAAAAQVLDRALEEPETPEVRFDEKDDVAVVYVGARPIIQLGPEDAVAAGDASLAVHAAGTVARVRDALKAERQRSAIATTVFSFSLVVFSALVAFLLLRQIGKLAERMRGWMEAHPERMPVLRVRDIEVVQASAVRGGLSVALSAASIFAQLGIGYAWILIALSLFESTRSYTEKLTGFVLTPVSALMGRVVSALPLLVIALITVLVVGVAMRFVRLFFGSVSRGETQLGWLPKDLAAPTSFLVRCGIVVVSLVVASPLVTGSDEGTLSRAGVVALCALGLAATPILASAAAGIAVVFGRRVSVGEFAIVGGRTGKVVATTMLEVRLEDEDGCETHVPHLLSLLHPMRILGRSPPVDGELTVAPIAPLAKTLDLLAEAAARTGARPRVEVLGIDSEGAHLRVTVTTSTTDAKNKLLCNMSEALQQNGVALGRGSLPGIRTA